MPAPGIPGPPLVRVALPGQASQRSAGRLTRHLRTLPFPAGVDRYHDRTVVARSLSCLRGASGGSGNQGFEDVAAVSATGSAAVSSTQPSRPRSTSRSRQPRHAEVTGGRGVVGKCHNGADPSPVITR